MNTRKIKKLVDQEMAHELHASKKKRINTWLLTEVEVMGKVYQMTEKQTTMNGTKAEVISALASVYGKVTSTREMLSGETVCGYRTVDMWHVRRMNEDAYFFAERI